MQATNIRGFNLSEQQKRLWSFQQRSQEYRALCAIRLEGALDLAAFLHALQWAIERHTILRTTPYQVPGMDVPLQVIANHARTNCSMISLDNLEADQDAQVQTCFAALQYTDLDCTDSPSLRAWLFHLSAHSHVLMLYLPAFCADDRSFPGLIAELGRLYIAALRGETSLEEPLQYVDIAAWQDEWIQTEEACQQQQRWQKINLSQLLTDHLPWMRERSGEDRIAGQKEIPGRHAVSVWIEETLAGRIHALARLYDVSLASVLLACWRVAFWHLQHETNFIVGIACDGRISEELENVPGLYTRFVPINIALASSLPFEQLLTLTHSMLERACEDQLSFTWTFEQAAAEKNDGPPFFPVCFDFTRWPAAFVADMLTMTFSRRYCYIEPFVLKLSLLQVGERLCIEFYYDPAYFDPEQIERLQSVYSLLLQQFVERPHLSIGQAFLLTPLEQGRRLLAFRGRIILPSMPVFHQLFEAQAEQTPDLPAVISETDQLSYQELNWRANQLARILREHGAGPGVFVGLCITRSVHMLVGLLAILKAGSAYVPLDPESPAARLAYQLKDIQAGLLLTQQSLLPRLPAWDGCILCLETVQAEIAQACGSNLTSLSNQEELAYVMYTSGTTGMPKGVMISQKSVANYTRALCDLLKAVPGWQYALVSTLSADLGNTIIFSALASGGCVQVLSYETVASGEAFARWASEHQIDVLKIVPSHLSALLTSASAHLLLPQQVLVLGGEAFPLQLLERLRQLGAPCRILNHYGPTEATVGVLVNSLGVLDDTAPFARKAELSGEHVPLGKPLPNSEVYILSDDMQLMPIGVAGELYIGGAGVAVGYLHQPEQTAERFIPHPFSWRDGARLYRTGDLACYTSDGQIEFVGRRDHQVKIRGYRVELGEVESALRKHENIEDAIAILREDVPGEPELVGYALARRQPYPTGETLRDFLRAFVPEYMIPSAIVLLDVLPLTSNGKVDRQRLPLPRSVREVKAVVAGPRNPIEEILLDIWKSLLSLESIDRNENFFTLGGHSLLVTQLIARMRILLQVEIPLRSIFEAPTIACLAQKVELVWHDRRDIALPPLVPVLRSAQLPLSFAQQRLWFLYQLDPESTAYLIPRARRLHGQLHTQALEQSIRELIRRHEVLRTTFEMRDEQPVQVIQPAGSFWVPCVDLQGLAQERRLDEATRLAEQEAQRPCNLASGPLLRVNLLCLDTHEHVLLLTMHHIISDAWSNEVFLRELTSLYQAFTAGLSSPLQPLTIQYADFAVWQRQWLQGEALNAHLMYWQQHLTGVTPLHLPADYPRPLKQTFNGSYMSRMLPSSLRQELLALSQRAGVTLFMLLLGAFKVLLARYTGQYDLCVGTPVANRTHAELEGLIGFFVNTLALRTDLSGNPSFTELLTRVREVALEAYAHQIVPFEYLVEVLQPDRNTGNSPLFQVMFSLQEISRTMEAPEDLVADQLNIRHCNTKFDMSLNVVNSEQGLYCTVEYCTDLFHFETIRRLLIHWQTLLEGIVAHPEHRIGELPVLDEAERRLVLANNVQSYPYDRCLHSLFEDQIVQGSDRVALVFNEEHITYTYLNRCANQLARALIDLGVGSEALVGLYMERSPAMLIGLLGILKAGGAYVPMDPAYPPGRLAFMLTDAQISVIVSTRSLRDASHLESKAAHWLCLESEEVLNYSASENLCVAACAQQLAYVIYTSGSTGTPKGVLVSHANVVRLFEATRARFQFQSEDVWTLFHSFAFDFSVWELWGALLYGGRLVLVPYWVSRSPEAFYRLLITERVSILNQTPSAFRQLIDVDAGSKQAEALALRLVIFGGEALEPGSLRQWVRRHGDQSPQLVNMYGITETTVHVTHRTLRQADIEEGRGSVIGETIPDLQAYLLDGQQQPVPRGVPGELYVGGMGLARGYLHRPDLTAERFVPHPFSQKPGARLYRTGDLARLLVSGDRVYQGRIDQQVKIRGYRIEPGEVEAALLEHPRVQQAVVLVRQQEHEEKRLEAYVVMAPEGEGEKDLRAWLGERLPDYMHPAVLVSLNALPLTSNGKIDRKQLLEIKPELTEAREELEEARTPIGELLEGLWSDVLGRERAGRQGHFFEQGGHSLLATRLIVRVQALTGVKVSLRRFFEAPMLEELVREVEQELRRGQGGEVESLRAEKRPATIPLSFAQQRLWFLDRLNPGDTAYIIPNFRRFHGTLEIPILLLSMNGLVYRHESLRTTFQMQGDQPVQIIHPDGWIDLPLIDLRELAEVEREKEAHRLIRQEARVPFNLVQGPLLRTLLLRLGTQEHILLLTMHHIISDGWSMNIFYDELISLYQALATGTFTSLPPLPIQYADFALWQRQWLQGEVLENQLAYWRQQLREPLPVVQLPAARPRPAAPTSEGGVYRFKVPEELLDRCKKLGQQAGTTLFMTLMSACQCLLHYYTGLDDIVVGTDVANRNRAEIEGLIGFFVNQLVFRMNLSGNPRIREVLQQAREVALGAYVHQDLPFDRLVEVLKPERVPGSTPLFQVKLVLQNLPTRAQAFSNRDEGAPEVVQRIAKFDLLLNMVERERHLTGWLLYNAAMFDPATIRKFAEHLVFVLQRMTDAPDSHLAALVAEIDLLEREKQHAMEAELQQAGLHRLKQARRKLSRK